MTQEAPSFFGLIKEKGDLKKRLERSHDLLLKNCSALGIFGERFLKEYEPIKSKASLSEVVNDIDYVGAHMDIERDEDTNEEVCNFIFTLSNDATELNISSGIFHEAIHAIQYHTCPSMALYMKPSAPDTMIRICPRDYLLYTYLMEKDAFAKQSLYDHLCELLIHGELSEDLKNNQEYTNIMLQGELSQFMTQNKARDNESMKNSYLASFMDWLEESMEYRLEEGFPEGHTFVRLDDTDFQEISQTMGFNSFSPERQYNDLVLPENLWERLRSLNKKLGLEDHENIESFNQFLTRKNISREKFHADMKKTDCFAINTVG